MWRIGANVAYSSPWVKRSKAVTDEKQIAMYDSLTEGLILKPSAGCENPDKRTDTDTDIRPPGPRPIRILADTDIRISAGYPDAHRYPDAGGYRPVSGCRWAGLDWTA